jgi:2-keto-4-pentenoate hydratase/2-oxohepta-3-ene-1,7-dioic acid hydratase in catechol pathway
LRLATIKLQTHETAALVIENGVVPFDELNRITSEVWAPNLYELIRLGQLERLQTWYVREASGKMKDLREAAIPFNEVEYAPLYRNPRKIWGIGLNYVAHAADLSAVAPNEEPASFMKPDTSIIGMNDTIRIPLQSERTTAEAELGIVIGKECKDISEDEAFGVIAGFTAVIDMTAEDILQKNPRFLTRSKSFDTFFSFGPHLVTPDEVEDVLKLNVATVNNNEIHRQNVVANMTFRPWFLVSFHSKVMKLLPGDIISTGTPGAVVIRDGDIVQCRIDGFETLQNGVVDSKTRS